MESAKLRRVSDLRLSLRHSKVGMRFDIHSENSVKFRSMVRRIINPLKTNSFFLFGARGTGKSTFILHQYLSQKVFHHIDLLDNDQEERYAHEPKLLEKDLEARKVRPEWIFIDEIQKVPKLLDHVHRLIENKKQKFILSGSSSRKLKREGANLLAGRAFVNYLFPLTQVELLNEWNLDFALQWGGLPRIMSFESDQERKAYLKSYVQIYIREEIRIEQLVRNLTPFRDFLEIAAQMNGKTLNFSKIANEVGVSDKTVHSYFDILQDTYLGFYLPSFHRSIRKAQTEHPKFYLFDLGVKRQLDRTIEMKLVSSTSAFGEAFEHLVILEIIRRAAYEDKQWNFSYFRTKDGNEIDLIISPNRREEILVEIKSTKRVDEGEAKRLSELSHDFNPKAVYYFSQDPISQKINNVMCLPWQIGIDTLIRSFA